MLDVEVTPSIIRGKPLGRLAYFANFAVNSIESNSIVDLAENHFDNLRFDWVVGEARIRCPALRRLTQQNSYLHSPVRRLVSQGRYCVAMTGALAAVQRRLHWLSLCRMRQR